MIRSCLPLCRTDRDLFDVDDSLAVHLRRILSSSPGTGVDFHSISQVCRAFVSSYDEEYLKQVVAQVVSALRDGADSISRATSQLEMLASIQSFDALLASLLKHASVKMLPDNLYIDLLLNIGEAVLYPLIHGFSSYQLIKRFNCDTIVSECYRGWREALDSNVWAHISSASREWRYLDKVLLRGGSDIIVPVDGLSTDVYDFRPVMARTSIYPKPDSRLISRAQWAFFRYLISHREFSRHIIALINSHNSEHSPTDLNESNVTVTNNTPGRRGSVDSMNSGYQSADFTSRPLNSCMEMFKVHCLSFLASLGGGLLSQISNDLMTALRNPPSDFLRLVLSLSPTEASNEGHQAIKKYLSAQLLVSMRSMVRNRSDHTAAEDGCLSFLMKAEMSASGVKRQDYRVVSALVDSVLDFTVAELTRTARKKLMFFNIFERNSGQRKSDLKFVAWLQWLTSVGSGQSPLVQAMTQNHDGRKELRSLYREIAAGSISGAVTFWESVFADRVNACTRLVRADLRLLQTTANGLGITPVPVGSSELVISETPAVADSEQSQTPVTEMDQPMILQLPLDYRPPIEDEPPIPPRRSFDADIEVLKERIELVESVRPSLQEFEELRERIEMLEAAQAGLVAEFEAFKKEKARKKSGTPSPLPRDDPIPSSVDEKIDAVFKRLAEGS